MTRTKHHRAAALVTLAAGLLGTRPLHALELGYVVHAEASAARMVGDRKEDQFGWGGGGLVAPELTLGSYVGLELPVGALGLSDGASDEPGLVPTEAGYVVYALPGLRLRPFGRNGESGAVQPGGLWIAGGGGLAYTGEVARPGVEARLGYDFFANGTFRIGPSAGYLQLIETGSAVMSEDARIVTVGAHAAFEPRQSPFVDDDRDDDGLNNSVDRCPDDPEDDDAFEDDDGCPDRDNDKDGIADIPDRCPDDPEDRDGFEDRDGCPELDNDRDGYADKKDACPNDAEDIDGFEDNDGCPELDNDQDGIADTIDQCPLDPESPNGHDDDDGCPDEDLVRMVGDEIVLDDRVHFGVNSHGIAVRSWPLMQNVAKLLRDNPQLAVVHIQGHADDTGTDEYNQRLSERRGRAVRDMLVRLGVEPSRLVTEGFGEQRPRDPDTSVYARRKNRRVEFLVLERKRSDKRVRSAAELLPSGGKP